MKIKDHSRTHDLVKEVVFLLWKATGGTSGNGFLQDNPDADKEAVFKQASGHHDYCGTIKDEPGEIYMDYVFGRCMKTKIKYDEKLGIIQVTPNEPRATYQDWGRHYKTADDALAEAKSNLNLDAA